jgi:microcompartment protein CcmK/EutM
MILARVLGNVVSTVKHPSLHARAVFAVQPLDAAEQQDGDSFLAVDHAQAGPGDTVLVLREGGGIRQVLGDPKSPIRCLIVAVVDQVTQAGT